MIKITPYQFSKRILAWMCSARILILQTHCTTGQIRMILKAIATEKMAITRINLTLGKNNFFRKLVLLLILMTSASISGYP
jgi:hypothetical protein